MVSIITKVAKGLTLSDCSRRFPTRLLSTFSSSSSPSITHPPPIPNVRSYPSSSQALNHFLYFSPNPLASRLNSVRLRVNRSSPVGTGSDRPPTEMAPLFPGCDYKHWLIVMDKPGGEGANKQQMIDCYIQTLAKVLGSEEEAKKKIYNVSCERYFGFGCEIDEEVANSMENLPGVLFVLPDSYVDPEYQDYGAELLVNGEIVQRPPERQRRVEPVPQRERPRPNSPRPRRRY